MRLIQKMPNQPYPTSGSLNQGAQFAKMTTSYHGGKRKTMRGGSTFTPYANYPTSMNSALPNDLRELARIAPLDAKFTELPEIEKAAGVIMRGGKRSKSKSKKTKSKSKKTKTRKSSTRKSKRGGAQASVNAPTMLLSTPEEETAARLNPQWYTENTVVPNFRGPLPVPGSVKGGKRKTVRRY